MASLVPTPQAGIAIVDGAGNASGWFRIFLVKVADAINGTTGAAAPGVNQIALGIGTNMSAGMGTPNGVVLGSAGDLYLNTAGGAGATLWVKESGSATNTGWVGK